MSLLLLCNYHTFVLYDVRHFELAMFCCGKTGCTANWIKISKIKISVIRRVDLVYISSLVLPTLQTCLKN